MQLAKKKLTLINIYRPPYSDSCKINCFLDYLDNTLAACNSDTIVTGDFNFNTFNSNPFINKNNNIIQFNNFEILNKNTPTRLHSDTCLDHVIINNRTRKHYITLVDTDFTDHMIQIIEIEEQALEYLPSQSIKRINHIYMIKTLNMQYKNEFTENNTVEKNYDNFINKLTTIILKATKTQNLKLRKRDTPPWL